MVSGFVNCAGTAILVTVVKAREIVMGNIGVRLSQKEGETI